MIEVTSSNFTNLYSIIHDELIECDFIAFDLEYSGIELHNQAKYSLFDSVDERYSKLRQCLMLTSPIQFGIALFKRECDNEGLNIKFTSKVYNFLLLPPSFDILDSEFMCSSSALKFLRMHNIDLNKIFDEGISFVNTEQMNSIYGYLNNTKNPPFHELKEASKMALNDCHDKVFAWLNDETQSKSFNLKYIPQVHPYQLQIEIRKRFEDIWTKDNGCGYITIYRVKESVRCINILEEYNFHPNSDRYHFYLEIVGFSRLMKTIINFKRPIVGHNIFLDLVAIYQKFYSDLPLKFRDFREDIHHMFPVIYDTKFLFYQFRKAFPCISECSNSSLENLFTLLMRLNSEREIGRVQISMANTSSDSPMQAHHAGYDSYMAGASLLLLGQLLYLKDRNLGEFASSEKQWKVGLGPVTIPAFSVYAKLFSPYSNTVNLIRAREDCVSFDTCRESKVLPLTRPPYLLVYKHIHLPEQQSGGDDPNDQFANQDLTLQKVADLLAEHGQADSRLYKTEHGRNIYIVAMSSFGGARSVLKAFRSHPSICVRKYSSFSDSPKVQNSILCAAVLSTLASSVAVGSLLFPSGS